MLRDVPFKGESSVLGPNSRLIYDAPQMFITFLAGGANVSIQSGQSCRKFGSGSFIVA
jgi:hypothetical protein